MSTINSRQYYDAPEVVLPPPDSGLEAVKTSDLEVTSQGTAERWKQDRSVYPTLEGHPSDYVNLEPYKPGSQTLTQHTPARPCHLQGVEHPYKPDGEDVPLARPRWRRTMYWMAILCALIFVLGAVLGGVLGTMGRRRRRKQ
jgi:hypothetical protein